MKTLWDAVNELRGDLNNTWRFDDSEKYLHYLDVDGSWLCNDRQSIACYDTLGTTAEFNQLVKDMEYNFGKCSAVDVYDYARSKKEPLKPISKPLVYTQEMADDGVIPSIGMKLMGAKIFSGKGVEEWFAFPRYVVCGHHSDGERFFVDVLSPNGEVSYKTPNILDVKSVQFKPINTRTKKERAVDALMKKSVIFCNSEVMKLCFSISYDEWVGE